MYAKNCFVYKRYASTYEAKNYFKAFINLPFSTLFSWC